MRVEQAFIHVDVDNLRAVFDLLPRDFNRFGIIVRHDQFLKRGRASDVGAFADIDECCGGLGHHISLSPSGERAGERGLSAFPAIQNWFEGQPPLPNPLP